MSILVCGSLMFETIIEVNEKFQFDNQSDIDAYFVVPDMRRDFSGSAGNLAYNLKLLQCKPLPVAVAGSDFSSYAKWLKQCHIKRDYIKLIKHNLTPQSFVTRDMADNKITTYHSGAMSFSHTNRLLDYDIKSHLAVVAPDGQKGMLSHARELNQLNIPFLFYPHHTLFDFEEAALIELIELAHWMIVTEKQLHLLEQKIGLDVEKLSTYFKALVVSQEAVGCLVYADNICHQIPLTRFNKQNDFSGSDDAFCAGILYSLAHDIDWETGGRIASLMQGIVAEYHGAQTHHFNLQQFKQLFHKVFDYRLI